MKNRIELYPVTLFVLFMLLLSFPQTLLSQEERLAVVSEYEGDVKVEHESISKTVKKIGNRIRNSAVYEKDSVITMHRSTADLTFNDNTSLEIEENTSLTVSTRAMSGEEEAEGDFIRQVSGGKSGIVRNINIKAGKFLANITPSKSVMTEFETPTGVASVRGTAFMFAYIVGVTSIELFEGLIEFASAGNEVGFDVIPGVKLNVSSPTAGKVLVGVESGEVNVETNIGFVNVEAGESAGVEVDAETGRVALVAEKGKVALESEYGVVSIEEGGFLKAIIDAETGEVIVTDVEGEVIMNFIDGTTAEIEVGMSLGTPGTVYGAKVMASGGDRGGAEPVAWEPPSNKVPPAFNFKDFQQSSFHADEEKKKQNENNGGTNTPTPTLPEAFRDDFSSGTFGKWDDADNVYNAYIDTSFGTNIKAKSGDTSDRFAIVHTGGSTNGQNNDSGSLTKNFDFTVSEHRQITFDYNFITSEYPDFVGSNFNDYFTAELHLSNGDTHILAHEDVNTSAFDPVSGLPTNILGFSTGGETGWTGIDTIIWVPSGITQLVFGVHDVGDDIYDSAVLLDNVVDPIVDAPQSTDYMLTFARMLSGDIDPRDADLDADAVISAEHKAFIAKVNKAIDIENSSDSEFVAGQDAFFDRLLVAKDTLESHEDSHDFLQKAGVAHRLLEASIMATDDVGSNIASIKNSLNQAKTFLVAHVNDFGETDALANIRTSIDSVLANIDNGNNNEFTTATIVAIRNGIKQAFSDTIDHMNEDGHECITGNHPECEQS
ncbi:MAG: FecR domain-containing protein [Candidatus Scalindua sp.]|nr:FecR domain-containing protein [Candidatus Scalindua sp.]